MKKFRFLFVYTAMFSGSIFSGCSVVQDHEKKIVVNPGIMESYLSDKPEILHRLYKNVLVQGERNVVLNHMRAGLAAMDIGEYRAAEESFDIVLDRIETIYADDEKAKQAKSNFYKENIKDFKGESYERAMAYYYRGLLYLMRADYGNARASFKSGMLQDIYAENEEYAADFALLAFLEGWASKCDGSESLARQGFDEAVSLRDRQILAKIKPAKIGKEKFPLPEKLHNVLFIGDSGLAPIKIAAGESNEKLKYKTPPKSPVWEIEYRIGGMAITAPPVEDIFWQAATRGGRAVDFIMEGKAEFKKTTDQVGNVLVQAGAGTAMYGAYSGNDDAAVAGLAMILVGALAKGISAATRADADIRYWDNLPEFVHLGTASIPMEEVKEGEVTVEFKNQSGKAVPVSSTRTATLHANGSCGIVWSRSDSALNIPDEAPASSAKEFKAKVDKNSEQESEYAE